MIPLIKRRIIVTQEVDGVSQYKLHGLIAESLNYQLDISKQSYSNYLNIIDQLKTCDNMIFVNYAECIGYSLNKYDICYDNYFLVYIADKLSYSLVTNYAVQLYEKITNNIKQYIPDCNEQNLLVHVYNSLALSYQHELNDYTAAEKNYNYAIEAGKNLSLDNNEYQYNLAKVYNNLANLQNARDLAARAYGFSQQRFIAGQTSAIELAEASSGLYQLDLVLLNSKYKILMAAESVKKLGE